MLVDVRVHTGRKGRGPGIQRRMAVGECINYAAAREHAESQIHPPPKGGKDVGAIMAATFVPRPIVILANAVDEVLRRELVSVAADPVVEELVPRSWAAI